MKRKTLAILLVTIMAVCCGCTSAEETVVEIGYTSSSDSEGQQESTDESSNTASNGQPDTDQNHHADRPGLTSFTNQPLIQDGNYLYYVRELGDDNRAIYKVEAGRETESNAAQLIYKGGSDIYIASMENLQIVGDWLYFCSYSFYDPYDYSGHILRVNKNSGECELIVSNATSVKEEFGSFAVVDGWVYYGAADTTQVDASTYEYTTYLCRASVDGENIEPLTPPMTTDRLYTGLHLWTQNSDGDFILYDDTSVYIYKIGDSDLTAVRDKDDFFSLRSLYPVDGGFIGFWRSRDNKVFTFMSDDLTEETRLDAVNAALEEITKDQSPSDKISENFLVVGDKIFFTAWDISGSDDHGFYWVAMDGQWGKINNDSKATALTILNNGYLYYRILGIQSQHNALYRVLPDGTGWEEVKCYSKFY